tara:strand:- start:7495 stop:8748 length:1254 start_codon:yes stop_codon:yes gene_type:complete
MNLKITSIYIFSSILSAVVPFILLPILTRVFPPEVYGQIAMYMIFVSLSSAFIGLNTIGATERKYFETFCHDDLKTYNGNSFIVYFFSLLVYFLVISLLGDYFSSFLGIPLFWLYLAIINSACLFIINFRLGQWQIRLKAVKYGVVQISNALINMLISLFFVITLNLGGEGRVLGIISALLIVSIYSCYSIIKDELVIIKYKKIYLIDLIKYGVPLIPHVIAGIVVLSLDRVIINKELGLELTGIYMVAASLSGALSLIFHSINKAYTPWLFTNLEKNCIKIKKEIVKKTYIYFVFLIFLSIISFFLAPLVFEVIVGERYHKASDIISILVVGHVFLGMYLMVTNYIFYTKRTKLISIATIISSVVNILLLLFLVPIYELYGAALAFMISNCLLFIVTWIVSARVFKMPWVSIFYKN